MTAANTGKQRTHTLAAKSMHWGFIVIFGYALTKQLDEVNELEDAALLQNEMVFAVIFLVLLIARFIFMQLTQPTVMGPDAPRRQRMLARIVHLPMYLTLFLIPASGIMIGILYESGTKSGSAMEFWLVLHEIAVNSCYFLIGGHVVAALVHRHKGDGIWHAMVPFVRESKGQ